MEHAHLELEGSQLNPERTLELLDRYNSLIIRRFTPPQIIAVLAQRVQQVFELRQREYEAGLTDPGKTFEHGSVPYLGLSDLDSAGGPPYQILGLIAASRLLPLFKQYVGTPMFCNVGESAARRVIPERTGMYLPFHQDGFFNHQPRWKMINCWVPLVPCGRDAPGIDLLPIGLNELLEVTPEEKARHAPYAFSESEAFCLRHSEAIWHPVFEPGDLLLMNPYAIHRTYGHPFMKHPRYSLELRFTGGTDIPAEVKQAYSLVPMP